ncbi:MAG: endonuclease/exonuclease/phosphatase family protein [Nitrospirales bacterium]
MLTQLRIATFNLENFDDKPNQEPTLNDRIALMRPQLARLKADILCFQEVNGQEESGQPRRLLALQELLKTTPYAAYRQQSTMTADGTQVYDERNLVIVSRFDILDIQHLKHHFGLAPQYKKITANPPEQDAKDVNWERPIQYARINLGGNKPLHLINLHLKSKLASNIPGQKIDNFTWKNSSGWAEGFFLSSIKHVGQALETRMLIDSIFNQDENALVVVCGDFNAEPHEVPVTAIRGDVENTGNGKLASRVLVSCEHSIPTPSRYTLFHHGKGEMIDHVLASRAMLACYKGSEIHNEILHDESIAFAVDKKFPESDHAPFVADFQIMQD